MKHLGISPAEPQLKAFDIYCEELLRWNRTYNLTAITNERDIINKHFLDSLLYLLAIPRTRCSLCDVGSGAGFPGVPIAIIRPDILVTPVESSRKRAAFLYYLRQKLALNNLEIVNKRIEDMQDRTFDVITTRALFSPEELIRKTCRLLSPKGVLILSQGQGYKEGRDNNLGQFSRDIIETYIPNTNIKRILIIIQRQPVQTVTDQLH